MSGMQIHIRPPMMYFKCHHYISWLAKIRLLYENVRSGLIQMSLIFDQSKNNVKQEVGLSAK